MALVLVKVTATSETQENSAALIINTS